MRILRLAAFAACAALVVGGLVGQAPVAHAQNGKPAAKPKEKVTVRKGRVVDWDQVAIGGEVVTIAVIKQADGSFVGVSTAPSDNPRDGDFSGALGRAYDSGATVTVTTASANGAERVTRVDFPRKP